MSILARVAVFDCILYVECANLPVVVRRSCSVEVPISYQQHFRRVISLQNKDQVFKFKPPQGGEGSLQVSWIF